MLRGCYEQTASVEFKFYLSGSCYWLGKIKQAWVLILGGMGPGPLYFTKGGGGICYSYRAQ